MEDERHARLKSWLNRVVDSPLVSLQPASSDASFRQYFRAELVNGSSRIVMDAPPDREDSRPFVQIAALLTAAGVQAPEVFSADLEQGFLLLSDLGDESYLARIDKNNCEELYGDAIATLLRMQKIKARLPAYNRDFLLEEMNLFVPWYFNKHLGKTMKESQLQSLNDCFDILVDNALEQPQVFVHRDYHARNLMVTNDNNPGVLDFQDAVIGPVTYDLVSLFKDCYIKWPRQKVENWIDQFLEDNKQLERNKFIRWFDLMGVQRHLKVLGIFSRLNYRDNKPQYLEDLPLTLSYTINACRSYPELEPLLELLE